MFIYTASAVLSSAKCHLKKFVYGRLVKAHSYFSTIVFLAIFLLAGCATPVHRSIKTLELGMDKADVLDVVGSPRISRRKSSMDEWIYIYYQDNQRFKTQLLFKQGLLVKKSPFYYYQSTEPPISTAHKKTDEVYEKKVRAYKKRRSEPSGFVDLPDDDE